MKSSKKFALTAILSAMAVILLLAGSLIETITFSSAAIASLCVIVAVYELGYYYAASVWMIASTLGIFLLPIKDPVLYFSCFFGYYPILKSLLEKLKSKISYLFKALVFSASYALVAIIALTLLVPNAEINLILVLLIAYPILLIIFFIFDFALTKLTNYYCQSLRKRLGIDKFLK